MGNITKDCTQRAIAGDLDALSECWRENRRWLLTVLLAHCPRGVDAEDLLGEVALRVVREISELSDPAALRAWLRVIAVNVARSSVRQASLRSCETLQVDPIDPRHGEEERREESESRTQRILQLVDGLRQEYREPLLLKAVHGWSQRQIAATLGVPVTTVETRLARARRSLRAQVSNNSSGASSCWTPSIAKKS